ncbi:unnamed protein product [Hydatigera taeniaeformis]|uniref:ORF2 n=1 Tax=Hydatigena taeniaeformis TaxID=6205 RepID=A0A0R3XAJ3_HYDTA|nr:unnamed protein product [Hydatigera taeniaeformis]
MHFSPSDASVDCVRRCVQGHCVTHLEISFDCFRFLPTRSKLHQRLDDLYRRLRKLPRCSSEPNLRKYWGRCGVGEDCTGQLPPPPQPLPFPPPLPPPPPPPPTSSPLSGDDMSPVAS